MDFLAYIKYEGSLVEEGYLDARKSAEVLIGIDEVLRYFLYQIDRDFQNLEFEIPIRIRKGSWESLIPHTLGQWLTTAVGAGLTTYASTALKKIAENDFKDKGVADVLKKVIKSIKWVIKISTHVKSLIQKQFVEVDFKEENGETLVGVKNAEGETIYVPIEYLELYQNCPERLFSKLTKIIEEERELEIGFNPDEPLDKDDTEKSVKIGINDKYIFTKKEEDDTILFPELVHNQYVELEGHVSRGNENTNTIGFEYLRHILTCLPSQGNIKNYKTLLFTNCLIKGYIDRMDDEGNINEKKPRIRFIDLIGLPSKGGSQLGLFGESPAI
ncbi:hypothetical protein [Ferruginibacter sp.]